MVGLFCWVGGLYAPVKVILFFCRFPVVAMGVLKWVDWTVSEPRYFQLQTDHTPVHLALLDEVKAYRKSCWRVKTLLTLVSGVTYSLLNAYHLQQISKHTEINLLLFGISYLVLSSQHYLHQESLGVRKSNGGILF